MCYNVNVRELTRKVNIMLNKTKKVDLKSFDNSKNKTLKNWCINKKIKNLLEKVDALDLDVFAKIVKIYLTKNCKKEVDDYLVWKLIEKMEEIK